MSELMLNRNIFEDLGDAPIEMYHEKTIDNILNLPIPNFSEIRSDIDPRLNDILHTALKRPREQRYQTAEEMLIGLEKFIYGDGYGPTNEKLAKYANDLFGEDGENAALRWHEEKLDQKKHKILTLDGDSISGPASSSEADPEPRSGASTSSIPQNPSSTCA